MFGSDAFETATGVHAAAVIKALRRNDTWLANRVYSGVPADEFGLAQRILVGPMSGKSNVIFWLEAHGYETDEKTVDAIFKAAKDSNRDPHRRGDRGDREQGVRNPHVRCAGNPGGEPRATGTPFSGRPDGA